MRTFDRVSSSAALSRLRGGLERVRRAMMARPPAVRVGLVLAPFVALAAAGYWAGGTIGAGGTRELAPGRSFSSEDLIAVCQELDARNIPYRVRADERKVEVAADQYDQAAAAFAKLNVGPTPFSKLRDAPDALWNFVDTHEVKEQKERLHREKMIERFLGKLDGVVWSIVSIRYPRPAYPRQARPRPSAFVYVESEADLPLPSKTVQAIPTILAGNEVELSPDAITVMDRKGHFYLAPSDPNLGKLTRDRAREEDLRNRILERLSYVKGVQVWVELDDRRGGTSPAEARAPVPASSAARLGASGSDRRDPARPAPAPRIVVNRPAELDAPMPPATAEAPGDERIENGRVLVIVPRSYYYNRMLPRPDHREPSVEELRDAAVRTREQVEKIVSMVVPDSWKVEVDTMADDVPTARSAGLPNGPDRRRLTTDWGIVGIVGAVAASSIALVMALGSWIQAARRPARRVEPSTVGRRYREDAAGEPGPSERVRELVRRDPEAAASVLQRWATQGGGAS